MNKAVYGKTMENVRNRINFKLLSCESELLRLKSIPKFFTWFNENLIGVHLLKKEVELNKPIFIGQNILDESKVHMYDFYYNFFSIECFVLLCSSSFEVIYLPKVGIWNFFPNF